MTNMLNSLNDSIFELGSRHFSILFRHSFSPCDDGSLSLNECLSHAGTSCKIRQMQNQCHERRRAIETDAVPQNYRQYMPAIKFLSPLAYVCCNSNKSRVQIGNLTRNEFSPGKTATPTSWFTPAEFTDTGNRQSQADMLEGLGIANIFLRIGSGHSNQVHIEHTPFRPMV